MTLEEIRDIYPNSLDIDTIIVNDFFEFASMELDETPLSTVKRKYMRENSFEATEDEIDDIIDFIERHRGNGN